MQMRKLGARGPELSVVGFGAWEAGGDAWGPNRSDDQVVRAIRAGIDAGMNWIDTAEVYGHGRSERLVGRAVEGLGDDVLVFTKVAPEGSGTGFRPEQVREALARSLKRLGIDSVDLYQLHWRDPEVPVEETWGAMAELQDEGFARHIGVSNFDRHLLERCLAVRHVDSVQNRLSLLHREDRASLLPWLGEMGIGYLAYSPLGLGLLTGAVTRDTRFEEGDFRGSRTGPADFRPDRLERHLQKVDRMRPIAERLGLRLATLALRWVLEQPGVTAAIAGSRDPGHTRENASAGDVRLDERTLAELDEVFSRTAGGSPRPPRG